jgi:hypothetical protein
MRQWQSTNPNKKSIQMKEFQTLIASMLW